MEHKHIKELPEEEKEMTRDLIAVLINESEILRGDVIPDERSRAFQTKFKMCYWADKDQVCLITRQELVEVLSSTRRAKASRLEAMSHESRALGHGDSIALEIKRIGELICLLEEMTDAE